MAMNLEAMFPNLLTTIGLFFLCKHLLILTKWLYVSFLRPPKNLKHYGSWCIVTGSTDGIGKALAFELASKGLNLVLVGRNPSKLETTIKEICTKYDKQILVKGIVIDFSTSNKEEVMKEIRNGIEGLDVGVVINNAGVGCPYPEYFHEIDLELIESHLKVNVEAATWVSRAVIPLMLKKRKGAIVNIGSGSSVVVDSYPLLAVYASTKAYLDTFSRSMDVEYKQFGIDFQCQIPLFVATKMTKLRASSFLVASPETYAKASLRWIGYDYLCTPVWSHSLQWSILNSLPNSLKNPVLLNYFHGIRKKALKKISIKQLKHH